MEVTWVICGLGRPTHPPTTPPPKKKQDKKLETWGQWREKKSVGKKAKEEAS